MGYCTVADVATFLQLAIAADNAACLQAIEDATAAIDEYCEQTLSLVEDDEHTFDVSERQTKLFLPYTPVTEVTKVVEDGDELTVTDDYKLGLFGILHRVNDYWYSGVQTVEVTYSHGYASVPQIVKTVCARAAGRAYQAGLRAAALAGVAGVQAQTIGDYSVTFGSEVGGGVAEGGTLGASAAPILLPSERRYLDRYKRERV